MVAKFASTQADMNLESNNYTPMTLDKGGSEDHHLSIVELLRRFPNGCLEALD
jgi:hypothetical protein